MAKCFFFSHVVSVGRRSLTALGKEWVHSKTGTPYFPGYKAIVTYRDTRQGEDSRDLGRDREVICEILLHAASGRPVFVISMTADDDSQTVRVSSHSATRCMNSFFVKVLGHGNAPRSNRSGLDFFGLTRRAVQRELREVDKENAAAEAAGNRGKRLSTLMVVTESFENKNILSFQ